MELCGDLEAILTGTKTRENIREPTRAIQHGTRERRGKRQINHARDLNIGPPETQIKTASACRSCAQEGHNQFYHEAKSDHKFVEKLATTLMNHIFNAEKSILWSGSTCLSPLLLLGVLSILFGFFILLTRISANHINGYRRISEVDLRSTDFVNDTVATAMFDEVRILCWIMTNSENYIKRAIHIKKTWGKRCNKLLFMGSRNHEDWNSIELAVGEGRNQLWNKTKAAFTYIYKYHLSEADWFLKTDDDTYIIMENLRYLLYPYHPETPIYFGCEFRMRRKISREIAMFMSGGAGYVLSKEALRRFVKEAIPVSDSHAFNEDVEMGVSLKKANVDCCSEYTIAFHYIGPHSMYIMDFLLYNIQPYGIVSTPLKLPKKLELNIRAKPSAAEDIT
uniref:N-acetylgalactosaminide beta-1,3-galactosyltransferase n=1 Tax=Glossina morsitans morsitans TaxID=37546 RepID=A0A1B0G8T1_GLOMM